MVWHSVSTLTTKASCGGTLHPWVPIKQGKVMTEAAKNHVKAWWGLEGATCIASMRGSIQHVGWGTKAPCGWLDLTKIQLWNFGWLVFFLQRGGFEMEFPSGKIIFHISHFFRKIIMLG